MGQTIKDVSTLKIHTLSQQQYNTALENGEINPNEIYLTPDGENVQVIGKYASAEGSYTIAEGDASHAEGESSQAIGTGSHAEGKETMAAGSYSHAEGFYSRVKKDNSSDSKGAHAEGYVTIAHGNGQHVQGKYNVEEGTINDGYPSFAHIQGWGNSDSKKNIHTLDISGNAAFAGDIYVQAQDSADGTCNKDNPKAKRLPTVTVSSSAPSNPGKQGDLWIVID